MLTKKTIEALPKFYGLSAMLSFIHSKQSGVATHTMIAAAAKLANKDLPDFSYRSVKSLNAQIQADRNVTDYINQSKVIHESAKEGILQIRTRWSEYVYEGFVEATPKICTIKINGMDFESRHYDSACKEAIENVKILLEETKSTRVDSCEKVRALFEVFKSNKNTNHLAAHTKLQKIVNDIFDKDLDKMSGKEARRFQNQQCNKIIDKYLAYLWQKNEDNTSLDYISGFESWLNKNRDLFLDGLDEREEQLNLYLDVHKTIVDTFMREKAVEYLKKAVSLEDGKEKIQKDKRS